MNNLERAKQLLNNNKTCVLVCGDKVYDSEESGIKPMLNFIENNINLKGFSVADKIVGKAAALLFVQAGITEVFAKTISKAGTEILNKFNIKFEYDILAEYIVNRKGDGICPMEQAVSDTDDPNKAYLLLRAKVEALKSGK